MTKEQRDYLAQGLHQLGLNPDERALERLDRYLEALLAQNQVMNLTAITDPWEVIRLHFFDSAALLPTRAFPHKRVLDVGTGAGFPGGAVPALREGRGAVPGHEEQQDGPGDRRGPRPHRQARWSGPLRHGL